MQKLYRFLIKIAIPFWILFVLQMVFFAKQVSFYNEHDWQALELITIILMTINLLYALGWTVYMVYAMRPGNKNEQLRQIIPSRTIAAMGRVLLVLLLLVSAIVFVHFIETAMQDLRGGTSAYTGDYSVHAEWGKAANQPGSYTYYLDVLSANLIVTKSFPITAAQFTMMSGQNPPKSLNIAQQYTPGYDGNVTHECTASVHIVVVYNSEHVLTLQKINN